MTSPKILAEHNVGRFVVTRFLTRFGDIVWLVSEPGSGGHTGAAQGTRPEIVAFLRVAL